MRCVLVLCAALLAACGEQPANNLADALAASVKRLADAEDASKDAQPVIDAVETLDHKPLFALHPGDKPLAFALTGTNLSDAQCADPEVTATDGQGAPLARPMSAQALMETLIREWEQASH